MKSSTCSKSRLYAVCSINRTQVTIIKASSLTLMHGKGNTMSMLSGRFLLLIVSASHAGTAILEDVVPADLEAVRIRLEEEKAKRLLLQNDVEVLMLQLEEMKRKYGQKEDKACGTTFPAGGTTYIRWGRTVCPGNGTELVYKGYMAGSEYKQTGNGPNRLCLPEDPTWAKYQDGLSTAARVYGTEFEPEVVAAFTFNSDITDREVPCVACRTTRFSSIMIPGRTYCYSGWTLEYSGYLVSEYYNFAAPIEYVCLDGEPEAIEGGKANTNGHLIYPVEVVCGTLRCPPYFEGRELACVVCSK